LVSLEFVRRPQSHDDADVRTSHARQTTNNKKQLFLQQEAAAKQQLFLHTARTYYYYLIVLATSLRMVRTVQKAPASSSRFLLKKNYLIYIQPAC
jgi:hypothetical protein